MSVEECQGSGMVFDSVQYGHSSVGRTELHCTVVNTICYDVVEAHATMWHERDCILASSHVEGLRPFKHVRVEGPL